jgi:tRNA-Thr(GGU) m(6)t(6)A37 methyltransferase TsaA
MMQVIMTPIGVFHTDAQDIPRHWTISDVAGDVVMDEKYQAGLRDIQPGQKIIVIFCFHQSPPFEIRHLVQKPKHKLREMGVFSICSPLRPNPIGVSVLKVIDVKKNIIRVLHADMIDGTPILDIKPYIPDDFKE